MSAPLRFLAEGVKFIMTGLIVMAAWVCPAQVRWYHHDRSLLSAATEIHLPTGEDEVRRWPDMVAGAPIKIDTNRTSAMLREAEAWGYDTAEAAWTAVVQNCLSPDNVIKYPGIICDNVGWVKGTRLVDGKWSAYLWLLQNQIAFRSSTTDVWLINNSLSFKITNVLVGTLGSYPPLAQIVDVGPTNGVTRFPGKNRAEDAVFRADLTTRYQLRIPRVRIVPHESNVVVNSSDMAFGIATNCDVPQGVSWSLKPTGLRNGALLLSGTKGNEAQVRPGGVGTNYTIHAVSRADANCFDTALMNVIRVEISPSNVYAAVGGSNVEFKLTNTFAPSGVRWSLEPPALPDGARLSVQGDSARVSPGNVATNYAVRAAALVNTNAAGTGTLTVCKVKIAMDGNGDKSIDFNDPADAKYVFWVNDDHDDYTSRFWRWTGGWWGLWAGKEDDLNDKARDCDDDKINCKRDLEDFTPVRLMVDEHTAGLTGVTYYLCLTNVSVPDMQVNLFPAADSTFQYLYQHASAAKQLCERRRLAVSTNEIELPKTLFTGNTNACFLLEGKAAGTGKLTFRIKREAVCLIQSDVMLTLTPIEQWYDRFYASISSAGKIGAAVETGPGYGIGESLEYPYLIYVHGWNMEEWEKQRWAETLLKRLWWQGYKGRIGLFSWPTGLGAASFDASEHCAWLSGNILQNRIAAVDRMYSRGVYLYAHSLGNVVAGEALRLLPAGVKVKGYLASQAAISAHTYDRNVPDYRNWYYVNWPQTPNVYAYYFGGTVPDKPYFTGLSDKVENIFSYYNPGDYALTWWQYNNYLKPDDWAGYGYEGAVDMYQPAWSNRFYRQSEDLRFEENRYEIFARCAESRSWPLGQVGQIRDFTRLWNLTGFGYNGEYYSHSRQFRSNIIAEWQYWHAVREDLREE